MAAPLLPRLADTAPSTSQSLVAVPSEVSCGGHCPAHYQGTHQGTALSRALLCSPSWGLYSRSGWLGTLGPQGPLDRLYDLRWRGPQGPVRDTGADLEQPGWWAPGTADGGRGHRGRLRPLRFPPLYASETALRTAGRAGRRLRASRAAGDGSEAPLQRFGACGYASARRRPSGRPLSPDFEGSRKPLPGLAPHPGLDREFSFP
jgi:hypothetical protein